MEPQRCPMCGQANPPDLEVCQYCQARLKPLWVEPSEGRSPSLEDRIAKRKTPLEADEPLLPEWLMAERLQGEAGEESPLEGTPQADERSTADDFLAEILGGEAAPEEEEYPQWLRSLRAESAVEPESAQASDLNGQDEALPFWLDFNATEEEKQPDEPSPIPQKVPPFSELPFEGIDFESELLPDLEIDQQVVAGEENRNLVPPFEGLEATFLEEETAQAPPPPAEAGAKAEEAAFTTEEGDWINDIPAWVEALAGEEWQEESSATPEQPPEFFQGVVPPFEESDEPLSEIEFPAWLEEAERSIEPTLDAVIANLTPPPAEELGEEAETKPRAGQEGVETPPPEREMSIETVGPLHGLRGVLPAEPLIAEPKKPVQALSELLVTEKQRAQAELFLKMIEEEGKPQPIPPSKGVRPHLLWRMLIFLTLVLAAAVGLIAKPFSTPPQELSVAVFDAMQAVAQLPAGAPVLLIVDMEGSDFAEMQAIASALLDQMMIKGVFFVVVSADQSGVLQSDRLLREVSRLYGHTYQPTLGWVNLGYLPGGVGGMQAFSQSPRTVLPNTVDIQAAWQSEPLKDVHSLSDFALVTVISQDSTRARQWIEQLKGQVAESRLIFAVSAQVEPVLRPYYEANPRQLQSLIAGIGDGAIFETQSSRLGMARQLWEAYPLVVLSAIALIIIGSAVYALLALFQQRKSRLKERGL